VQAAIDGCFRREGGRGPAFETIVGSGANACVLHYVDNAARIGEGDLVLVDAGAEVDFYAGDITRTVPASGRFTPEQRAVYEVVWRAEQAALAAVAPGRPVADVHDAALAVLVDGMVELGLLEGDRDEIVETEAYKAFFPHQTSHWLGLDVHDVGDYALGGAPRPLEPGMVLTVEPGLYVLPGGTEGRAEAFEGIGVRVEDDVLVTAEGHEVLTGALPSAPDDVERAG
ncbi:MAG: Xaa-Pro dipeptidase, partial [Gemmatimonadetes bacterium]